MQFLSFLIVTVLDLYVSVLLLRVWMQWARADFYNPFSQFVVKITQPIIGPLRRVIPSIGPIDTASLLVAYILILLKYVVGLWLINQVLLFFPVYLPLSLLELLTAAGKLVFWVIIIRALMSWISQGRNPVDQLLIQLTEPLLSPIRRLLPSMGGIDLSPMVLILILYALNYLKADVLALIL
ncbi:YggT family protein [Budviciaceae bacterium CWB-B4]|uniref:YggT family protein n=1 Tax=Limnobaculum xujianqingii TaxID=2738837 RepID=A0A9D7AII6_9GAMM|nr:YggT family protein [Limnobaculum xujianqingii]MBK5073495.1 YggT family protein [Limnobaculum xujianqingii]MBK5176774.1 YggT family protein [Limnobaculum xujianqingii]